MASYKHELGAVTLKLGDFSGIIEPVPNVTIGGPSPKEVLLAIEDRKYLELS